MIENMNIFEQIGQDTLKQAMYLVKEGVKVSPKNTNKFNLKLKDSLESVCAVLFKASVSKLPVKPLRKKLYDIYCIMTQPRDEPVDIRFGKLEYIKGGDDVIYGANTVTGWGAECRLEFMQLIERTNYPKRLAKKWCTSLVRLAKKTYFEKDIIKIVSFEPSSFTG